MVKRLLFSLILMILCLIQTNAQEKCWTQFNPNNLSKEQREKLQQFNDRVRTLHQNFLDKNKGVQEQQSLFANDDIILIPVVVHVVWNTFADNLSNAQIQSQIEVLNEDFRRLNTDADNTPGLFQDVAGDSRIQFYLACEDPNGNPTNGITRTQTSVTEFDHDDMKFASSGGKASWNTAEYLNIWVCDLNEVPGTTSLGYAQFPEDYASSPATDGVVVTPEAFGRNSAAPDYDLGRTATHEVGHWAGLYHIWSKGGAYDYNSCSDTDEIPDTPNQDDAGLNCPSFPNSSCGNTSDMYMNYMDYTNDACKNMFTQGQITRMRANFDTGGFRDYFQFQTVSSFIPGDGAVCYAGDTYSISSLPAGAGDIDWEVGPWLEIVSGDGTNNPQIKAATPYNFHKTWIVGSYTLGCYGRIYVKREAYTNTPYPDYISSDPAPTNGEYCTSKFYEFAAMFNDWDEENYVDSYQWSITPTPAYDNGSTSRWRTVGFSTAGNYTIKVRSVGACGLSLPAQINCQVKRCTGIGLEYLVAPNPADNSMTIMFRQQASSALQNTPAISEKALKITLYDYMFRAVRSAETIVGSNVTFNTSDLTAGMYYLHVSDGSNTDMQQVLIQH